MTQMSIAEAEHNDAPAAIGSVVKLRFSELSQEIAELGVRIIGRPVIGMTDTDGVEVQSTVAEYLWSLQYTIAAGTSQIQRNVIAERILGLPRGA
jgi:alkylation response protein AidB-like acyl-CoA dehydrogenase